MFVRSDAITTRIAATISIATIILFFDVFVQIVHMPFFLNFLLFVFLEFVFLLRLLHLVKWLTFFLSVTFQSNPHLCCKALIQKTLFIVFVKAEYLIIKIKVKSNVCINSSFSTHHFIKDELREEMQQILSIGCF